MKKRQKLVCLSPNGGLEVWNAEFTRYGQPPRNGDDVPGWTIDVGMVELKHRVVVWIGGISWDDEPEFWGRVVLGDL